MGLKGVQHFKGSHCFLENKLVCVTEGNRNRFPPPTKGDNTAALPIALFKLTYLERSELRSWVLEVHGILAQTVVFSSSPWPLSLV